MDNELLGMSGMGLTDADKMLLQEQQADMIAQAQHNPFNSPQYQNIRTPDEPINYGGGMMDVILSDSDIPSIIRKKYWWIFNKDNVLTFLDAPRKQDKMISFDIAIIDTMNSMDSFDDYTFESELQYNLMRNALDVKLDRAVGFTGSNMKNERIILQSHFSEARQISESDGGGAVKEGFFKRLLSRRG